MAQEPKKFDVVTILGIALAIGLFFLGNMYMQKNQAARQAWEAQQKREQAEALAKALPRDAASGGATIQPVAGQPQNGAASPVPPDGAPAKVPEEVVKPSEDVTFSSEKLTLTFTSQGGTLKQAWLANEFVDPSAKTAKGLEILGDIDKGKRTFGLKGFDLGPQNMVTKSAGATGWRVWGETDSAQPELSGPSLDDRVWKLESKSEGFDANGLFTVVYSTTIAQKFIVTKTFYAQKDQHYVSLKIEVANKSEKPVWFAYSLYGPAGIMMDVPKDIALASATGVLISTEMAARDTTAKGESPQSPEIQQVWSDKAGNSDSTISKQENLWASVRNRFYTAVLISVDPKQIIRLSTFAIPGILTNSDRRMHEANIGILALRGLSESVAPASSSAPDVYALYLGPKNEGELSMTEDHLKLREPYYLTLTVQYCDTFYSRWDRVDSLIARPLLSLFKSLYFVLGSYGAAVVLLTLLIKIGMHPLQRKMMISMSKMQKLQPELKKIQEKYKSQTSTQARTKMALEQQDVMRKAGANPITGCLPMFIQLPIFWALYGIFNHAFEIRGATFLWIKDLSEQDALATLSFWPNVINLLPLLYMAVTIVQARLTPVPKNEDPQQEMNRKMMMYMPVIFTLLFYRMPSGLVLYFAASAIFSVLETWYIKKFLIKDV